MFLYNVMLSVWRQTDVSRCLIESSMWQFRISRTGDIKMQITQAQTHRHSNAPSSSGCTLLNDLKHMPFFKYCFLPLSTVETPKYEYFTLFLSLTLTEFGNSNFQKLFFAWETTNFSYVTLLKSSKYILPACWMCSRGLPLPWICVD